MFKIENDGMALAIIWGSFFITGYIMGVLVTMTH